MTSVNFDIYQNNAMKYFTNPSSRREELMCCASWSLSPEAFVLFILSLPAKSQLIGENCIKMTKLKLYLYTNIKYKKLRTVCQNRNATLQQQ